MQYNQRKLQILSIFNESAMTAREIYDKISNNNTSFENIMMLLKRYYKFGLVKRFKTSPYTYKITKKGIERLGYLRNLEIDRILKLLRCKVGL